MFDNIQKTLISHKAKNISFDYSDNGKITTLAFVLNIKGNFVSFKLPARVEKVESIFLQEKKNKMRYQWEVDRA